MRTSASTRPAWVALVGLFAAMSVLGSACAKQAEQSTSEGTTVPPAAANKEKAAGPPKFGGGMVVGVPAETDSFSPYSGQWSMASYQIANAIFDPLAASDELGIPHQYLAKDFVPNGTFTEWSIALRQDVTFHNGQPLDAAAVKKNLDLGRTSGLTAQAFAAIESVEVKDPLTVVVKMNRPWATFPASLAGQAGYMAAPAMLDDPAGKAADPIGTGPFQFVDRQRDAYVKTKRYANYWQKAADGQSLPYLDTLEFKVIPDSASRSNALAANDLDAQLINTPDAMIAAEAEVKAGQMQAITDAGQETDEIVLAMNTTKPPFDDPLARQALAAGIDQSQLSTSSFKGAFPGAWGMFDESSPYFISKQDAGYPAYDVAAAKDLVAQYTKRHGSAPKFNLLVPPDSQYLLVAQTFQSQAKELGMEVEVTAIEQTQLINKVIVTGDYQGAGFVLWSSPTPDRSYVFLATKANPSGLSLNFSRYDDEVVTTQLDKFRAAGKPEDRVAAMTEVQKSLAKNLQVLFLVHQRSTFEYHNLVHGVRGTNFIGTDRLAYSPQITTPFLTNAWKG